MQQASGARRTQLADHPLRLPHGPWFLTDSVLFERRPRQPPRVLARWRRYLSSPAVPRLNVLELDSTWYWLGRGELLALSVRRQRQPPELQHFPLPLGREYNGWLTFNRDRTGLWAFAEGVPGVFTLRPRQSAVQALPVASGQRLSTRTIGRLPDGRLVMGSYSGSFTQAADSPRAPLRPWAADGASSVWFCSLRLPDARLVVRLKNYGILLQTGSQFGEIAWAGPHPDPVGKTTFCLLRTRAGQLWAGGQQGLFQLDLPHLTRRRYREGDPAWPLHRCEIEAISEGASGELWLATNQGLYALQPATGALRRYGPDEPPPYRLPTALLRCVLITHPDSVWVGTQDAGLLLLHPRRGVQRQLTLGQGLPSEAVAFVLAPPPGRVLWVGTYNGLVRYEPRTGRRSDLTTAEGLATNELNRQSAWYDAARQRLYVGGVGGLSFLEPQDLTAARHRPRLLLTSLTQHHAQPDTIRTDYLAGALPQGLTLAPGDAFADLALSLSDDAGAELGRFAYRLRGTGPAPWQELGTGNRLRLQGLEPSDYTLEIKGETELGTPTRNVLRVPVRVRTYWWRRPGVWALLTGLLVAAAVGGVYGWQQRRIRRREQRWEADHALRQRLAADLHDELGALLTRVTLRAELLEADAPAPQLAALIADSRAATTTVRDIIWSVNAGNDTVGTLVDRIRDLLSQTQQATAWTTHFALHPLTLNLDLRLKPDVRQHVYLICKEAVTNALRHARGGRQLWVRLAISQHGLELGVTNDGTKATPGPRHSGQGTHNMQLRAEQLAGTLHSGPCPDGGWEVTCRLDQATTW